MTTFEPTGPQPPTRRVVVEAAVPLDRLESFVEAARRAGHLVEPTERTAPAIKGGGTARIVRLRLDPAGLAGAEDG